MRPFYVAALAVALVPAAHAATTTTTVPNPLTTTSATTQSKPRATKNQSIKLFIAYPKVADWLKRYPPEPDDRRDVR